MRRALVVAGFCSLVCIGVVLFVGHLLRGPSPTRGPLIGAPIAFSRDGKRLLTIGDEDASLWDALKGNVIRTFEPRSGRFLAACFANDGAFVLLSTTGEQIVKFDANTGSMLQTIRGTGTTLVLSRNNKHLFAACYSIVRMFELETGRELAAFRGHAGMITSIALSGLGNSLITGSADGTVRIWNIVTKKAQAIHRGFEGTVHALGMHKNGRLYFAGTDHGAELREIDSGAKIAAIDKDSGMILSLAISGNLIATSSGQIWDIDTRTRRSALRRHGFSIPYILSSADGKLLATSDSEGVNIWDPRTGEKVRAINSR